MDGFLEFQPLRQRPARGGRPFRAVFPDRIDRRKEIVRTWLYYTMLKSALLLDRPAFKHVWIDGLGMDPGKKMSKSLGTASMRIPSSVGAGGRTGSWRIKGPGGSVALKATRLEANVSACGRPDAQVVMIFKSIQRTSNRSTSR